MNCETARNQLIDLVYVEGAIDPLLQQHVESCSDCQNELAELTHAKRLLECFDNDPVESLKVNPPGVTTLKKEVRRHSFWKALGIQALAVGCAALLGAIGGGAFVARLTPQPPVSHKDQKKFFELQQQLVEVNKKLESVQAAAEQPKPTAITALATELKEMKRRQQEAELSLAILRDDMKFFGSYVAKYTGR